MQLTLIGDPDIIHLPDWLSHDHRLLYHLIRPTITQPHMRPGYQTCTGLFVGAVEIEYDWLENHLCEVPDK